MAGASFTTSIPLDLYAALVRESEQTGESRNAIVRRALESALGGTAGLGTESPAQTRASEESSRSSRRPAVAEEVAEIPKEPASGGPARGENTGRSSTGDHEGASPSTLSSGTRPRRSTSAQAKANVKPIRRKS